MRAGALAVAAPLLRFDDSAVDALRTLTTSALPGIVAFDGARYTVIPGSQVLRIALPRYILDDPALARVWDEASADALATRLRERTVADLVAALDRPARQPEPSVDSHATTIEVAAVMSAARVPLVAVVDGTEYVGVITVNALVEALIA